MDTIKITNLVIFAHHGVFPQEKELGQKFALDVELKLSTQKAGLSGDLEASVDYGRLAGDLKEVFQSETVDLLETLAERLSFYILETRPLVEAVTLTVHKPWAPVMTQVDDISVTVTRRRNRVFLSLGSNMGDSEALLGQAVDLLTQESHTRLVQASSLYQTKAWGLEDQDDFLNQAIELETYLEPEPFLGHCQEVERVLGRERLVKWGPRLIDVDVLFYNDAIIYSPDLIIPHPYIADREFVLEPLTEIAPHFLHPTLNRSIRQLLADLQA